MERRVAGDPIGGAEVEIFDGPFDEMDDVGMRDDHSFGDPRRTGGVQDVGGIASGCAGDGRRDGLAPNIIDRECDSEGRLLRRVSIHPPDGDRGSKWLVLEDCVQQARRRSRGQEPPRVTGVQNFFEPRWGTRRVERNVHATGLVNSEQANNRGRAFGHQHADPVPFVAPSFREDPCDLGRAGLQLGIRQRVVVPDDRDGVRTYGRVKADPIMQEFRHG